jgi:hypothetical protein
MYASTVDRAHASSRAETPKSNGEWARCSKRFRKAAQNLQGMRRNILAHWPAVWTFIHTANVEPTNNRAERSLRKAVLWRKGSFGTQSSAGSRLVERILTVTQTCA